MLLEATQNWSENWNKIFSFIFDTFLFIFDLIWNTKLPMTNTSIAYYLIFFMIVKLSIYAIHGTQSGYNNIGNELQKGSRSATNSFRQTINNQSKKNTQRKKEKAEAYIGKQNEKRRNNEW